MLAGISTNLVNRETSKAFSQGTAVPIQERRTTSHDALRISKNLDATANLIAYRLGMVATLACARLLS